MRGRISVVLTCPLCNRATRRFEPLSRSYLDAFERFGIPFPPDRWETLNIRSYACPACGSSDRDRLMWLGLRRLLDERELPLRVLDVAPAPALSAAIRKRSVAYVTADLMVPDVDVRLDMTRLPFPDATFDIVLCSHVLEHIVEERRALAELRRVLAPDASGFVLVPIALDCTAVDETTEPVSDAEGWARFGQNDHVRLYSRQGLVERLECAGLSVSIFDRGCFGRRAFRRHGLTPTSALYAVQPAAR